MARIFTTQFKYNHQRYDAIVTVIHRDGIITFNVKVLDLDFQEVLPGGEFIYKGIDGIKKESILGDKLPLALMQSISTAIEEHLASID